MKLFIKSAYRLALLTFIIWTFGFGLYYLRLPTLAGQDDGSKADGIVVLTGGAGRIDYGMKILKSGRAKRMLISGVNPVVRPEALQKLTGVEKSLFDCCIDLDHKAGNTQGNAFEATVWAKKHEMKSIILVTSDYHMPRSLILFRRSNSDLTILPAPAKTDASATYFIREYNKYIVTLLSSGATIQ